jgi:GntR family transcriptional repressor for pyruvate dehydrogenase complex
VAVTNDAIEQIKSMILRGDLTPGDRLPPEKELAESLGLSRSSLREAIKALVFIRVLDVRQGDGTYVTSLEPKFLLEALSFALDIHDDSSLLEIFEVRRMLESRATGLAAEAATPEDVAALRVESAEVGAHSDDWELLVEHDVRFHKMISNLAGNDYLASLIDGLTSKTVRARVWRVITQEGAVERTLREHELIIDAIEAGNADLAIAAATVHISGVEDWLRKARRGQ